MADRALTTDEQILARATKAAIQAAGGLEDCERETGTSDSQLSRCCSPHQRDSITIRDAVAIESIGHGQPGHPHILRAMARVIGGLIVVALPDGPEDDHGLVNSVLELTTELGDVSAAIASSLRGDSAGGADVTKAEAALALEHLHDLDQASAKLRRKLERIAKGEAPPG
jgi:hypothetical protein